MIDNSVQQVSGAFVERWGQILQVSPLLTLDGTWPSVAVLDLICTPFRFRKDLTKDEMQTLRGASAYLALIVERCWATFAESVQVKTGTTGVQIKATGGKFIPEGEHLYCNLEQRLHLLLTEVKPELEVLRGFSRPLMLETNLVSLFALGVCTGFSPAVEGAWEQSEISDFQECLQGVTVQLAKGCAESYSRVCPDEPFGQVAELYLGGPIFPPLMMGEPFPCANAVDRVLSFFSEYKVKSQSIAQVVYNFTLNPDEVLASTGLTVFAAVASQMPPQPILARAQSLGRMPSTLRPAMLAVRKRLGMAGDWAASGFCTPQTVSRFRLEQEMGFLPWFYLSAERLLKAADRPLVKLLVALASLDLEGATQEVETLLEELPDDLELHLQKLKLELVRGDHEKVCKICRALVSQPESDGSDRFYNLWGLAQLQGQDNRGAIRSLKAAAAVTTKDSAIRADVFNNLGWAQIVSGQADEALQSFDRALETSVCPVTILLNKGYVLWQAQKLEELAVIRAQLLELAPTDRRVFAQLASAVKG